MVKPVEIVGAQSEQRAALIAALGGEFQTEQELDALQTGEEIVADCLRLDVRALRVLEPFGEVPDSARDLSWVSQVADQLVVLAVGLMFPRGVESWESFGALRSLSIGGWKGRLDFRNFPVLEDFGTDSGGPGIESLWESSPLLKHLWFHRFKGVDLSCLADLSLASLSVTNSRKLERVRGIESQAGSLRFLELELDTQLSDLGGLEALGELVSLHLSVCNKVTDLAALSGLSKLKYLVLTENKSLDSIEPLFGLENLEVLHLPHDIDQDLSPLLEMPSLRYVSQGMRRAVKDGLVLPDSQEALQESYGFRAHTTELGPS